jgi:hypothetical protein
LLTEDQAKALLTMEELTQKREEKTRKREEKQRRFRDRQYRWRFLMGTVIAINLFTSGLEAWIKLTHWPGILRLHGWLHFAIMAPVGSNIFGVFVWSLLLVQWSLVIVNYKREQARTEQETQFRAAVAEDGVWPPPPTTP